VLTTPRIRPARGVVSQVLTTPIHRRRNMASVSIRRRETKSGPHFQVRFRLGGRTYPVQHGGSFPTLNEARTRRDLIAGELAAGRNPAFVLDALLNPPEPARVETLREIAPRYEASRIDREGESRRSLGSIVKRIIAWGGDRDPNSLTWGHCQEFVGTLSGLKPGTVRNYFDQFRLLLDFAGCDPNPARDKRVKLPKMVREEASSPTAKQYLAILDNVPKRWLLPFVTQEQCAMHIGEVASLAWGDVDVAERKFLLRYANVKGAIPSRARNVQVPEWVMEAIEATCPLEDRTAERRVFPGLEERTALNAMATACKNAGILHFSPKALRHRRASIWHHGGVVARVLAERLGHSTPTETLNTYSHTLDPGEVPADELRARVA
jgi:integrase